MVLLRARTPDWRETLNKQEPRTPFIIDQNTGNIFPVDIIEEAKKMEEKIMAILSCKKFKM